MRWRIVGETGKGAYFAEAHRRRVAAELADSAGEAFGVQTGGFAHGAVLVHALAPVGDDQGHQGSGPATTSNDSFIRSNRVWESMRC
jgi:hypothetical protein